MESYAHRLQEKIAELDDDIAEMEAALTRARAQRAAYTDALNAFRQLHPVSDGGAGVVAVARPAASSARQELPDAPERLNAIIAVLRGQPEQMMKAGALLDAVSAQLGYDLSRHHVADLLRSHPEHFASPRRGYWVLTTG